jgi:type IV pilus assembly protein PilC
MSSTTFTTRTLDPRTGIVSERKVEGGSADEVRASLTLQGLTPLDVRAKAGGLSMEIPGMAKRVKPEDLAVFARMFATLMSASMPVVRSLTILTKQTENPTLAGVLGKVTTSVQGGKSVSVSLAEHPATFPPLMINLIKAGEVGGFLEEALVQVANSLEADARLRSEIKGASTYPIVVMCMGVVGAAAMLIWIVPVFATMFSSLGGTLPLLTRIVMRLSDVIKVVALPGVVVGVAFSFWWRKNKNSMAVRSRLDPVKLRLPVFGILMKKIAIGRFARNLSVMQKAGVPILEALSVVGATAGNTVIEGVVTDAAAHVRQGAQLSEHLGDGGVFPDMVVQMVSVGEESGSTDAMLAKVADFYDEQVRATTQKLEKLLEPFLIVFIGLIIGTIIVAIYLPTFQIMNLVK